MVPPEVLGRFSGLVQIVATLGMFVWNYSLFGMAQSHLKGVFVGVAAFFAVMFLMGVWRAKEGEYPPPRCGRRNEIAGQIPPVYPSNPDKALYHCWAILASPDALRWIPSCISALSEIPLC